MILFIILLPVFLIVYIFYKKRKAKKKEKKSQLALTIIPDFKPVILCDKNKGIPTVAIDTVSNKFAIGYDTKKIFVFSFKDLVSVEVVKDGDIVQTSDRGSQAVGAAAGAMLLGPLGLAIGALSGSRTSKQKVNKLSLKIFVNDIILPFHEVVFFNIPNANVALDSKIVKSAITELDMWHGRFQTILKSNSQNFN